jgi:asparagine synthase (glutamine-hydrolysing)
MTSLDKAARSKLMHGANGSRSYLLDVLRGGPHDSIDRLLRADLLTYLPEDLLVKMDRATMGNSLEARSPLLDHELVEYVARLPIDRKIVGRTTKVLLREIAKRLMPASHVDRPKMGFSAPIGEWFRGRLGERFEEIVLAPDALLRDHMDQATARGLLAVHRDGQSDLDGQLWSLLMFELWARRWLRVESAVP